MKKDEDKLLELIEAEGGSVVHIIGMQLINEIAKRELELQLINEVKAKG